MRRFSMDILIYRPFQNCSPGRDRRLSGRWQADVMKRARHCLRERKLNETIELPDPKDITTFAEFMQQKMKKAKKPENYDQFKELQQMILARLIQYNRRRPGELQVLRCVCYTSYSN